MLKILEITETLASGVGSYVTQLCNDMSNYFDIYLAYSTRRPETPKNYKELLSDKVKLIEVKNFAEITNVKQDLKVINELQCVAEEVKPDVIHLHSSIAGGIGRLAYRKSNAYVVYTPHGYAHILMGRGVKSTIFKLAEKALGRKGITLTCCESENDEAKKFCKNTCYIETGVNVKALSNKLIKIKTQRRSNFTVFTLGRACVQKQPALFNGIAKLVPEANFIWIGDGELRNLLNAENITVTGWKTREDALGIAKGADVFILCSLGESIAMSLLEVMYLKKVVLVSDVIGNKSVIKNGINGYVCRTAEEYASTIRRIMKQYPTELIDRAYKDVLEIYNTDNMIKKYIRFYNSPLDACRGGVYAEQLAVSLILLGRYMSVQPACTTGRAVA